MLFSPEPGLTFKARYKVGTSREPLFIVLNLEGAIAAAKSDLATVASNAGWNVLTMDLRATGEFAWPGDKIGRAPDHTTSQWAFWIGRPLLGQWIWDIHRLLDGIRDSMHDFPKEIAVAGIGPAGIVALTAAALDHRITRVVTTGSLATFVTDVPYEHQRMGTIVPGILKQFGDIPDLAALVAPRPLLIIDAVTPADQPIELADVLKTFQRTAKQYNALSQPKNLHFSTATNRQAVLSFLSFDIPNR
jgi:hypothetical protein